MKPDPVCDFCSSAGVAWCYPTPDFLIVELHLPAETPDAEVHDFARACRRMLGEAFTPEAARRLVEERLLTHGSRGGWAACEGCSEVVEQRDLHGLVRRALTGCWGSTDADPALGAVLASTYRRLFSLLGPRRPAGARG